MIRAEYCRFLQTLGTAPPDVHKVANLVLAHLDILQPLSTAQGQRVRKVAELAKAQWDGVGVEIAPAPEAGDVLANPIYQLKSLSVGPFRGFARHEEFDLASSVVLIYGPNGTGKTSFCEALEYALLGSVLEADNKRLGQDTYLKNAHTDTFVQPTIKATDRQGQEVNLQANEAGFRFCFVEKNRIDSFSRIAAQTPAKQTELISTLFGLDTFNEFVRNFSAEMDERYIDLVGVKAAKLKQKQLSLAGSEQQLSTNIEELKTLEAEEHALADNYRSGLSFAQLMIELRGDAQNLGRIKTIENELQQPLARKSGLTLTNLKALQESVHSDLAEANIKQQKLSAASQQVSFKQLFEAVSQVQPSSPDHCPACKTAIGQTAENPYSYASSELEKLQTLGQLQQELQHLNSRINQSLSSLAEVVNNCIAGFPTNNSLSACQVIAREASVNWWDSLQQPLADTFTPLQHLDTQVNQLEEADKALEQAELHRANNQQELTMLREIDTKITQLQTRRATANIAINSATTAIANFETVNSQLITEATAEVDLLEKNRSIASAYATFVVRLNNYKNSLPALLVADLGDRVVELYNAFNLNDLPGEKLASVRLPMSQNQSLKICFQNNADKSFDALHVLSEGHIRCMGLAILLAKNLKENCPLVIFDDPVNAIDDDHRESIRRALFEDDFFGDKQIILACHGEEFFKDIQNLLSAQDAARARTFTFLQRLDDTHIRVDFDCAPRNYVVAARQHFDDGEIRDALSKARRALESLTKGKLWTYVSRYGDGNLSIKLRSANAPIELRNLTEQLNSKIAKPEFSDQNKNALLAPIGSLLGINGDSREWRYLNKGTHEEENRAEFDRNSVQQIISALEQIDIALAN